MCILDVISVVVDHGGHDIFADHIITVDPDINALVVAVAFVTNRRLRRIEHGQFMI